MVNSPLNRVHDRIRGCMLGGAVGDALGAAVEFTGLDEIRRRFGPKGITHFVPAYGRIGAITDDTQMTLFTAEGLIRAWVRQQAKGICGIPGVIFHAYLRWLLTQSRTPDHISETIGTDGWLYALPALHSQRAPGMTCLSALRAAQHNHGPEIARNDSKGCGGVMRVAPIGLVGIGDDSVVFDLAASAARLTHGHPSGYLAAGYFAVIVAALLRGDGWENVFAAADMSMASKTGADEVIQAVAAARELASHGRPTPEALESLGGGWVAEEALGISICCALTAKDFSDGIILGANHSGDSDSTASMVGQLLGAMAGESSIPEEWLTQLELATEIGAIADDMFAVRSGKADLDAISDRYPGW